MVWRFDLADVSHYQDDHAPIDWPALAAGSPGNGAATKATQRHNYKDSTFDAHRAAMKATGMRRRGLYHWQSPVVEASIADQAAWYLKVVGVLEVGEFVMIDAEQGGITEPESYDLLSHIEAVTRRPSALYGGISTAGGGNWRSDRIRNSPFGPRCMWLAAYMTQEKLAARLDQLGISHLTTHVNQYSSDGPAPGVTGRCDLNQVNDFAVLDACCGYPVFPPPHPDNGPTPPTEDDVIDIVRDAETNNDKFAVMPDGTLRPLSGTELKARGIANSVELGTPLTAAERAQMGTYSPAGGTVDSVARDGLGHLSADLAVVDVAVDKIKAGLVASGT